MLVILRQRNFACLWTAGLVSLTGDWLLLIALPIYVYTLTNSTLLTSTLFLAEFVPPVLLGSVAGVFADRWDRRRTLIFSNLLQAIALLPLLAVHTADRLWLVYLVSLVESMLAQFFTPAEQALLPCLVGGKQLVAANSLAALNSNIARLVGAPLGGIVVGLFGLNGTVLLDAASFVVSSILIGSIARAACVSAVQQPPGTARLLETWTVIWREWLTGLRFVRHNATVSSLFILGAAQAVAQGLFVVLFVVFVNTVMHGGATEIGWLRGVQAIGGLLGGIAVALIGQRIPLARLIGSGTVLFGLIELGIWNAPILVPAQALPVAIVLFAIVGLPGSGYMAGMMTLMQKSVSDSYRGRVFGAHSTTSALAQLLGMILAGALGDRLGALPLLDFQAGVYLITGILTFVLLRGDVYGSQPIHGAVD